MISFGLVGTGHMAHEHAKAILKMPGAKLVAAISRDFRRAEEFAKKYGIKAYTDYESFLSDPEISIVDITSEPYLHVKYGVLAARRKKHILVEKPIATSIKDADDLINICRQNNVNLSVVSQYKLGRAMHQLKQAVDSGKFGRILLTHVSLKKNRTQQYYDSSSGWRKDSKRSGGGVLMQSGIHYLDILLWLFGPVEDVHAKIATLAHNIATEDTAIGVLRFKSGALATLSFTTAAVKNRPDRIEVYGDKGSVIVENNQIVCWHFSKNSIINLLASMFMHLYSLKRPGIYDQLRRCVEQVQNASQSEGQANRSALELILALYKSTQNEYN